MKNRTMAGLAQPHPPGVTSENYDREVSEVRTRLIQSAHLCQDEEPHNEGFWRAVLDELHLLRTLLRPERALQVWEAQADQASVSREYLLECLASADGLVDRAGITLSTYLPVYDSRLPINILKRQTIVAALLDLERAVQHVLVCLRPLCPHALLSRHTLCSHCGTCHYDQCETRTQPCVATFAFTVVGEEMLLVRFLDAYSATIQTWAGTQKQPVVMTSPFLAYRAFMNSNPAAVYVAPDEFKALAVCRSAEVKKA